MQMSDKELETLKQKRLRELQKRMATRQQKEEDSNANQVLGRIFKGRAWEVFNTAKAQFPSAMIEVEHILVRLAMEKKISEMEGDQLLGLLREIGLPVKMNTTIKVLSHGKVKSLSEKFKESMR